MRYICCSRCHDELDLSKGPMRSYERISVSMSSDKTELLIWCNRHKCGVARIGVGGALKVIPPGLVGPRTFEEMTWQEAIE